MKCLPASKVPNTHGLVLHDWHAEILAIRALNVFLLEETKALALTEAQSSAYLRHRREDEITERHFQPFTVREDVKLYMYCSEAPCNYRSNSLLRVQVN
jgi:tRNA-specific adenosine deaminase 1